MNESISFEIESLNSIKSDEHLETVSLSLLKSDEYPYSNFFDTLERNLTVLRLETSHSVKICGQLERKSEGYNDINQRLLNKLESLRCLAKNHPREKKIRNFTNQVCSLWDQKKNQVYQECSKIRVACRSMQGMPLAMLLNKIQRETTAMKMSLQIGEVLYETEYVLKGYSMLDEIIRLVQNLKRCDEKAQNYLATCKITSYLLDLESSVDKFVMNINLLPASRVASDFGAFAILSKLLTGELLDLCPLDPNEVLAESTPKKPVFITKNMNNRRKADTPVVIVMKVLKTPTFLPAF